MALRENLRRLAFGLQTLLGRRRGFFIPYRYAAGIPARQPPYAAVEALFAAHVGEFRERLNAVGQHAEALQRIDGPPPAPRFGQSWFPTLDAAIAYTLVRDLQPGRIVEVGSGHSTRFMARAVKDAGFSCRIIAIDPAPRASLQGLDIEFHRKTAQEAELSLFGMLGPGDVLFIDSSHIAMPGSDVDWLFNRILPVLPSGVVVHIHDILLPDDYPENWGWRGYNEQQLVPALLFGGWDVLFASHFVATRMQADLAASEVARFPQAAGAIPASLWLRRK